ncbi:MAG TPA: pectinesterase family protein [Polyangiaceae bacterium]
MAAGCGGGSSGAGSADIAGAPSAGAVGGLSAFGGAGSVGSAGTANAAGSTSSAGLGGAGVPEAGGAVSVGGEAGASGSGDSAGSGGSTAAGAAGAAGSAGLAGSSGGAGAPGAVPDCNSITGQAVITVAAGGTANFKTVQAALNSLSKTNTTPTQIRIAPGTYKEKLNIAVPNITLCGQAGKASSTILTYSDNANTPDGSGGTLGTTGGASTLLSSNDVSAENLTFENSTPLGGSQAVALLVNGDQVQFRNCRFLSYQDTLYVRKAKQYFRACYIEGSVDFIFGDATAVFDDCTVYSAAGGVAATAPNTAQSTAYGLVFLGGQLTAASGISAGSVALGRNWGASGAAAYLHTKLGAHISPKGWEPMGTNTLTTARFSEYKTTGAGASASAIAARAAQAKQLSDQQAANYTLDKILETWLPSFSK